MILGTDMKCDFLGQKLIENCNDWYVCAHKCEHPDLPEGEIVRPIDNCERCPCYFNKNIKLPIIINKEPWPRGKLVKTSQLVQDSVLLAGNLPVDITGVVGIPRSGMLPASVIATHLHLPLGEFNNGRINWLANGWRSQQLRPGEKLLFIDDTVYNGHTLSRVRNVFGDEHVYACVYARPQTAIKSIFDICYRLVPFIHFLEWNLINGCLANGEVTYHLKSIIRDGIGCDFDGVIVHDEMTKGVLHTPYLIPKRSPVPLVITGRGVDEMEPTLQLIAKYKINIRQIIMRPLHVPNNLYDIAKWKASVFKQFPNLGVYVESSAYQSQIIAEELEETGQYVLCIEDGHLRLGKKVISSSSPPTTTNDKISLPLIS